MDTMETEVPAPEGTDGISLATPLEGTEVESQQCLVKEDECAVDHSTEPRPPEDQTEGEVPANPEPLPMESRPPATCKYRWAKTIPTNSAEVIFFSSHKPNEPVVLSWDEGSRAFYSVEMQIVSGDFHGNLVVEGTTLPVEEHNVRPYTFELDLYVKDDVIEDEVSANKAKLVEEKFQENLQARNIDTYRDINSGLATLPNMDSGAEGSINLSSKYEELVRQQLQHKDSLDTSLELEVNMSQKLEQNSLNGSVRHTPVGDIAVDRDSNELGQSGHSVSSHKSSQGSLRNTQQWDVTDTGRENVLDDLDNASNRSLHSSARQTPQSNAVEDILGNGYTNIHTGSLSEHSLSYVSARISPSAGADVTRERHLSGGRPRSNEGSLRQTSVDAENRPLSGTGSVHGSVGSVHGSTGSLRGSTGSLHGSTSHMPVTEAVDDILERYSRGSNREKTESIDDVLESPPRSIHSSLRATPQRESKESTSLPGSQRHTPQKDILTNSLRSSQERLYSSQELHRSSYEVQNRTTSSVNGSHHSSRAQSVTSEQELSQFIDRQSGEATQKRAASYTGIYQSDPLLPPISMDRPGSSSSMPAVSSHSQDRHITTPENHIRIPAGGGSPHIRSPLVTTRSGSASKSSSRTVTPVSLSGRPAENGFRDESEGAVASLRKLLAARETEVHQLLDQVKDLRDINRVLQEELEHSRTTSGYSGGVGKDYEKLYKSLQSEKEILASEVVKLRDQLSALGGKVTNSIGIDSYSPDNPIALKRKIDDLEGHIQDMQEANETAMSHLTSAEKKVKELLKENDSLRKISSHHSLQELEDDNRRLQDKVFRLEEGSGDHRWRVEVQQLKDDLQALRERNYRLNDENVHLKEVVDDRRNNPYSHENKVSRETTATRDLHTLTRDANKNSQPQSSVRLTSSEQSLLNNERVRSLEKNYGSDRELRDMKYERKSERYLSTGPERVRSERDILIRTNRSVPDGAVADKLVKDSHKYGRNLYQSSRMERDFKSRDVRKSVTTEHDRKDLHSMDMRRQPGPQIDSSVIYKLVLERKQNAVASSNPTLPVSSTLNLSRIPPLGYSATDRKDGSYLPSFGHDGSMESGFRRHYTDVTDSVPKYPGRSHDYDYQTRQNNYERTYKDFDVASRKPYPPEEQNGELSDTATDILLSADLVERKPRSHRHRRQSIESVESVSSLSDEEPTRYRRRRSKSVDGRGDWAGRRTPTGSPARTTPATQMRFSSSTDRLSQNIPQGNSGFRSITPQPLVTQHNRATLGTAVTSLSSSLTQGMRPFAPRSPADMKIEDIVKFSRQGGKLSQGIVKFVGHLPGRGDVYLGVELDKEEGKHDGTFEGIRYFKCKPSKGVFVAFNKVVMAWAP